MQESSSFSSNDFMSWLFGNGGSTINSFFDYFYIALIVMAIIISLTTPVERGIAYFNFLMVIFGLLLLLTMCGIIYYLI